MELRTNIPFYRCQKIARKEITLGPALKILANTMNFRHRNKYFKRTWNLATLRKIFRSDAIVHQNTILKQYIKKDNVSYDVDSPQPTERKKEK